MGNFDERERREPQPVVIEDLRHRRDVEEEPEEAAFEPQPAPAPEPVAVSTPPPPPATPAAAAAAAPPSAAELGAALEPTEEELAAAQEAEYAYLMQVFQLGLPAYLHSQLGILLNFALINLGRAANPVTGIVAADLDQAKLAIDALEFILSRLQASLEPAERTQMLQMLSELKYTFMQSLSAAAGPPKGAPSAGGEG
jgi:hypothetical protein